jgi:predicted RNA binding protein YcfA (HicA-like mRNA interferase family)
MTAGEFLRKVRALARRKGVSYAFIPAKGKGSHGTLHFGPRRTVVKDRTKEVGPGLLHAMCKDLGIDAIEL